MSTFKPVVHVLGSGTCHPVPGGKSAGHTQDSLSAGEVVINISCSSVLKTLPCVSKQSVKKWIAFGISRFRMPILIILHCRSLCRA